MTESVSVADSLKALENKEDNHVTSTLASYLNGGEDADDEDDERISKSTDFLKPENEKLNSMLMAAMACDQSDDDQLAMATSAPYYPILMMKMMMNMEQKLPFLESPFVKMSNPYVTGFDIGAPNKLTTEPPTGDSFTNSKVIDNKKGKSKCKNVKTAKVKSPVLKKKKNLSANRRLVESSVSNPAQVAPDSESGVSKNPIYRCHLCSYTGNSKLHFNAHMNTHFDHRCPHCDYTSRTEGRLKRHIRDFHSETPPETWSGDTGDECPFDIEFGSDDGLTPGGTGPNPARNRKYRCKQCGYVAMDKHDFWEHSKDHIKTDKMLSCPKCNFVTEYKHHLEYHLRNHFGSKPFRCGKCNYSCVNKSMLNSHMKSHSNIYQYRCEDCTYATKYCHSLKLHLRKYKHRPATVLNLDGTPNPYPVIDVYGTRRGPRPKKNSKIISMFDSINMDMDYEDGNNNCPKESAEVDHQSMFSSNSASSVTSESSICSDGAAPVESTSDAPISSTTKDDECATSKSTVQRGNAPVTGALKCNYCPFHTESKADFSNHMLNHVKREKIFLINKARAKKANDAKKSVKIEMLESKEESTPIVTETLEVDNKSTNQLHEDTSANIPNESSDNPMIASYPKMWPSEFASLKPMEPDFTQNPQSSLYAGSNQVIPHQPPSIFFPPFFNTKSHPLLKPVGDTQIDYSNVLMPQPNYPNLTEAYSNYETISTTENCDNKPIKPLDLSGSNSSVGTNPAISTLLMMNSLLMNAQRGLKDALNNSLPNKEFACEMVKPPNEMDLGELNNIGEPGFSHKRRKGKAKRIDLSQLSDLLFEDSDEHELDEEFAKDIKQNPYDTFTNIDTISNTEQMNSLDRTKEDNSTTQEEIDYHHLPPTPTKSPKTMANSTLEMFDYDKTSQCSEPTPIDATAANSNLMQLFLQMLSSQIMLANVNSTQQGFPIEITDNLLQHQQNVNNLVQKMYSATSLMQEILVEMCQIKK